MSQPREYLPDPEQEIAEIAETSYEPIQADSQEEAEEICEELASEYGLQLEGVNRQTKKGFDCLISGLTH
ncbi:MAG: hypothetical protein WA919_02735 [Coleofasciculaceae cyanobacterium]